jgi:hypothetical protein
MWRISKRASSNVNTCFGAAQVASAMISTVHSIRDTVHVVYHAGGGIYRACAEMDEWDDGRCPSNWEGVKWGTVRAIDIVVVTDRSIVMEWFVSAGAASARWRKLQWMLD